MSGFAVIGIGIVVALVLLWPTVMRSKSIWIKDGKTGALKLGNAKAEVGVSYFASARPEINYLVTQHGEKVAEGKYSPPYDSDAFVVFPRDPAHDGFPFILSAEIVSGRMKITLQKRLDRDSDE